jgi:hypothetical protein
MANDGPSTPDASSQGSDGASTEASIVPYAGDGGALIPPVPDGGVPATVTVDRTTTLATIPGAFVGLSYEKSTLPSGFFSAGNTALAAMVDLLGPGILRIGGNTVDEAEWLPAIEAGDPQPDSGVTAVITPAAVDDLAGFLQAAGWKIIYGLDMKRSTPDAAALEASYASRALGASLYGFEIGNEPDLYTSTLLSSTWSYATFKTQWESFAAAIRASVPNAPLTGPAASNQYKSYTVPFAADEASRIQLLTQQYYRANGQAPTSTLQLLLQPDPNLPGELTALENAATSNGVADGYRMAECNSFYNGGAPNVSDAYGTALWAIDYLFTVAGHGASGVNFHGGGNGPGYTPIANSGTTVVGARPEFYGMLLFTKAGTGPLYATRASAGSLDFTAYAVGQGDGSTRIVLVNKDASATIRATVDAGKAVTSADVMRLEGPELDAASQLEATSGVTLGGAGIDANGQWSPAPNTLLSTSGQTVMLDVPPQSAALVHAQ